MGHSLMDYLTTPIERMIYDLRLLEKNPLPPKTLDKIRLEGEWSWEDEDLAADFIQRHIPWEPCEQLKHGPGIISTQAVLRHQRHRCIVAFAECVRELGWRKFYVRQVIETAKISRRSFYVIFEDLNQLFREAYEEAQIEYADNNIT